MTLPRFYPILDTRTVLSRGGELHSAAQAILEGGARIIQLRHKDSFDRETFETARGIAELCRRRGALFVINDRVDIAMLLGAAVHLGQHDLPPEDARRLAGPTTTIGFSTHNDIQFREGLDERVDYLAFGPIFGTVSKEKPDPRTGVDALRGLPKPDGKPLVAIGGITRANAREVLAAGADSVAVIGDLYCDGISAEALRHATEAWVRAVDED